jgi:DNA-binding SARP family transcriptional activator
MRYQVLGPVQINTGAEMRSVSAPKMVCVLTTLLLRANRVVSKDALIAEMWGDDPPRRAVPALHVHVSQLRKLLNTREQERNPLLTLASGYLMHVEPDELDLTVFQRLVQQGCTHLEQARLTESAGSFEQALALWRGPILGDVCRGPIVSGFVTWIEESRIECLEGYIEVNLRLGRHRAMVGLLSSLVSEYPLHEAFYGQLMRALHASERRADALDVYRRAWTVLDEELGLPPSQTLRELQSSLLSLDGVTR